MLNWQHLKDVCNSVSQHFLNGRSVAMQSRWHRSHSERKRPDLKGMKHERFTEISDSRFQTTLRKYRQLSS